MFRWLLIILMLAPCPCQWAKVGTIFESVCGLSRCSCCDCCAAEEQQSDSHSDGPWKKCPYRGSLESVPPLRISWNSVSESGIWAASPAAILFRIGSSNRSAREVLTHSYLQCRTHSLGRGIPIRV